MQDMTVECGECRVVLDESPSAKPEERRPCPSCGSMIRLIQVRLKSTVHAHANLAIKGRRKGQKKPFVEQKVGDDFHRDTGTWRKRQMVVDRDNDQYREVVTDPKTGEELHRTEEPLSAHQGHGSAKRRK